MICLVCKLEFHWILRALDRTRNLQQLHGTRAACYIMHTITMTFTYFGTDELIYPCIQQNKPQSALTSIASIGCSKARNAVHVRPTKLLYMEICAIHHKDIHSVLITKIATNTVNYLNHVRCTVLSYNEVSFI